METRHTLILLCMIVDLVRYVRDWGNRDVDTNGQCVSGRGGVSIRVSDSKWKP